MKDRKLNDTIQIYMLVFDKSMISFKTLAMAHMHITFRTIVLCFSVLSLLAVGCLPFVSTNNTSTSLLVVVGKMLSL